LVSWVNLGPDRFGIETKPGLRKYKMSSLAKATSSSSWVYAFKENSRPFFLKKKVIL